MLCKMCCCGAVRRCLPCPPAQFSPPTQPWRCRSGAKTSQAISSCASTQATTKYLPKPRAVSLLQGSRCTGKWKQSQNTTTCPRQSARDICTRMDAQHAALEVSNSQERRPAGKTQQGRSLGYKYSLELAQLHRRRHTFPQSEREAARYTSADQLEAPRHSEQRKAVSTDIQLSLGASTEALMPPEAGVSQQQA